MENSKKMIRPIVIYPFIQPKNIASLKLLFQQLSKLSEQKEFDKPVTIINNQTKFRCTERWAGKSDFEKIFKTLLIILLLPTLARFLIHGL